MKLNLPINSPNVVPIVVDSSTNLESKLAYTLKTPRSLPQSLLITTSSFSAISPRSIGGKFGKSKRGELFESIKSPGPGRYDNPIKPSAPAYSILGKKPEKITDSPGPGAYSPKLIVNKSNNCTIGKGKRNEFVCAVGTPGPGRYENSFCFKESPSWSFRSSRDNSFCDKNPGPGQYSIVEVKKSVGGAQLKAKRDELFIVSAGPGPASYNSLNNSQQSIQYSIGKSKRPEPNTPAPGPGKYNPKILSHSFSASFGKDPKKTLQFSKDTPGADAYSPKKVEKNLSFSFGLKLQKKLLETGPGPTNYSPEKRIHNSNVKIGKSLRFIKNYPEKELTERPGPGRYEIDRELGNGKFFVSKAKRDFGDIKNTPGPGSYNA